MCEAKGMEAPEKPAWLKEAEELEEMAQRYGVLPDRGAIGTRAVRHYRLMRAYEEEIEAVTGEME